MKVPLVVLYRGVSVSPFVERGLRKRVARLDHFHPCIVSCRVTIEHHHEQASSGGAYRVRIELAVPGSEIVVNRERHAGREPEGLQRSLRDSFDAARRMLEDDRRRHRRAGRGATRIDALGAWLAEAPLGQAKED